MDTRALIQKLLSKKEIVDYTYATLFFLISSIFAFFAIKPSLSIALSLKREAEALTRVNTRYEQNIAQIIKIQSQLEKVRSQTYLLHQATPDKPEIKTVIDTIRKTAANTNVDLNTFGLPSLELKQEKPTNELKPISMSLNFSGDYPVLRNFIDELWAKRRLTVIKELKISKETETSGSAQLESNLVIENYYL